MCCHLQSYHQGHSGPGLNTSRQCKSAMGVSSRSLPMIVSGIVFALVVDRQNDSSMQNNAFP